MISYPNHSIIQPFNLSRFSGLYKMDFRYYIVLGLILLNLFPVVRFSKSRYFHFFFLVCLIDPSGFILAAILNSNISLRYYFLFASVMYLAAFPLFDKKLKAAFLFVAAFSFLLVPKYTIVSVAISTTVFSVMIFYITEDLYKQYNSENRIELFNLFLIVSLQLNIIRIISAHEYRTFLDEYFNLITLIDIVVTLLIGILGPDTYFLFNKGNSTTKKLNHLFVLSGITDLTEREIKVINLISQGFTSSEIADKLHLSKKTIDSYRSSINSKLNISEKSELILFYNTNIRGKLKNDEF